MLSEALRMIRVFHNISQADLAKSFGISRSYLCEVETSKKKPTLDLLERYKDHFRIPVSTILLFSEELENDSFSEKARTYTANKMLTVLKWMSSGSKSFTACDEAN